MSASRNTTGTDNTVTATNAAADNTQAFPAIEGLDTKAAIQLLGSPQLYMTVLKDYYRVIKQKAELIKKYEQQEDWHAYTIETHALKSASRQIGATDLAESAARLELAGSRQDAALIHEQTASLLHDYLQYQSILQPYFQRKKKSPHRKRLLHRFWRSFFMPCMMQLIIWTVIPWNLRWRK